MELELLDFEIAERKRMAEVEALKQAAVDGSLAKVPVGKVREFASCVLPAGFRGRAWWGSETGLDR